MKSKFLLLVSLVLTFNAFSQNSCPTVVSRTLETVTASPCVVFVQTIANNPTGAEKGMKVTVYQGVGTSGLRLSTNCFILLGKGDTTLKGSQFACTSIITIVTESNTASDGACLSGNVCATTTQFFGGNPGGTAPVKLTSFDADGKNGVVSLKWSSESEIDFRGYQIEMNDGTGFRTIGSVSGKNNGLANNYSFEYNAISKQSVQVRLQLLDIDGKFTYSKTALVKADN